MTQVHKPSVFKRPSPPLGTRSSGSAGALAAVVGALWVARSLAAGTALAAPGAIVAVDEVQVTDAHLSARDKETLASFLRARLAEVPGLRVIPAPQVRKIRAEQLRDAVERCGDGDCPVELGRELAAQKVLVPRVARAGAACMVTLTYVDIRTATDELAATVAGGCTEGELAAAMARAVLDLEQALAGGPNEAPGPPSAPSVASAPARKGRARLVSVYITSNPMNMPVSIGGKERGKTPLRVDLTAGRAYRAIIGGAFPFEAVDRTFVARDWQRIDVQVGAAAGEPEELSALPEWFSFAAGSGFAHPDRAMLSLGFRAATFRWRHAYVTAVDLLGSLSWSDARDDGKPYTMLSVGPRGGGLIHLGRTGRHQLMLGAGVCYSSYGAPEQDTARLLSFTPGVEYAYMVHVGSAQVGGGLHAVLPVAGDWGDDRWPVQVMATLRFGISLTPQLRAAGKE